MRATRSLCSTSRLVPRRRIETPSWVRTRRERRIARHDGQWSLTRNGGSRARVRSRPTTNAAHAPPGDGSGVANSASDLLFEGRQASDEVGELREERSSPLATRCRSRSESAPRRARWCSSMSMVRPVGRPSTVGRCLGRRETSAGGSVPSPSWSDAWGMNHDRPRARTCRQFPRRNCLRRARRSLPLSTRTRGVTATRSPPGHVGVGTGTRVDQPSPSTIGGQLWR
jgi:hypothetical protein